MVLKTTKLIRGFFVAASLVLALSFTITANAATPDNVVSQVSARSDFISNEVSPEASWGEVVLTWNKKEFAYATTKTFAGEAYYLYAKISGTDELGDIPPSTNSAYHSESTTTGKIFSRSTKSSVSWTAYGEIKDTSTSGTQTASVTETEL
ncbi:MAG: hypothetical protein IMX04_09210 [Candidatus Carbobacillus altaicus]|nr:hypothetical protein [Candidatus Carbobacillus altaicus]